MFVQQTSLSEQVKPSSSSGVAILFFLLGAPHIYSIVKKRSAQKLTSFLARGSVGLITMLSVGTLMFLAF